jgi:hypothetical protein
MVKGKSAACSPLLRHDRPIRSTKSSRFAIALTPNRTRSDSEFIGFSSLQALLKLGLENESRVLGALEYSE